MHKYAYALLVLVVAGACDPDVAQNPPPAKTVAVQFDPGAAVPVVPVPNDLAKNPTTGKIVVPSSTTDTAAQKEFNEKYLGTLTGFPFESTAEVLFNGDLDPATVTPKDVIGLDVTPGAPPSPVVLAPSYDPVAKGIVVPLPAGGWLRAHMYAIALVAGANGIKGKNGETVVGSETWALVSSTSPLVACDAPNRCHPTVDVIPSTQTDPALRLAEQTGKAQKLEQIRLGYAPIIAAVAASGVDRASIPMVWTFSIVDAGEVTFDPSKNVIPFPNDVVRVNGQVALPNPKTGAPLAPADCASATDVQTQLTCGLDTLDGFSTLAPPISENSDTLGAALQANLDPASLTTKSVGIAPLASTAPAPEKTAPRYTPCLNCLSSPDASGRPQTTPQQLQWRLDAPLDEKTTYLGYVTSDAKDDKGKTVIATPAFALLRSVAPLVENGKSAVSVLTDAQAAQLEPLRAALKPALDGLEQAGVPRESLALAFPFTTQSEASLLDQLYGFAAQVPGLPQTPLSMLDATTPYTAQATAAGIPIDGIASFFAGTMLTPVAVTGPGGTLDVKNPKPQRVDFVMSVPKTPAPPGGYPVTIFGHGFTRWRNDFLAIANALAKAGQVTIATDVLFHGDRTSCTGSKAATSQPTDDAACADPATQKCNEDPLFGLCVAQNDASRNACTPGPAGDATCAAANQGRCAEDGKCQNADLHRDATGRPLISGWNIFSLTNFFATRDNFRQQVIDLSQLVNVIKSQKSAPFGSVGPAAFVGGPVIDTTNLEYVGQSLGGILGALFNAVSPDTTNVVLNVPGGALPEIILTAPSFASQKAALLSGLTAQGINPGTPAFDQFIGTVQWILDPADPANMGYRLTHPVDVSPTVKAPNANRKAFIQFIEGDQTVPNISNLALVAAANRAFTLTPPSFNSTSPLFCYEFTEAGDAFNATTATPETRHGFLLSPPTGAAGLSLTTKAQTQAATFVATGALQ